MTTMIYAGIGSRETPPSTMLLIGALAQRLASLGYKLRTGGAKGADKAFELATPHDQLALYREHHGQDKKAQDMAQKFHPAWDRCNEQARRLHARNCMIVLGAALNNPVDFVLCWTPDGAETASHTGHRTGGTGQAIRVAHFYNIPVFNLFNANAITRLDRIIRKDGMGGVAHLAA